MCAGSAPDDLGVQVVVHTTEDSEEAERCHAELSVGRLPAGGDEVPEGREAPG